MKYLDTLELGTRIRSNGIRYNRIYTNHRKDGTRRVKVFDMGAGNMEKVEKQFAEMGATDIQQHFSCPLHYGFGLHSVSGVFK